MKKSASGGNRKSWLLILTGLALAAIVAYGVQRSGTERPEDIAF